MYPSPLHVMPITPKMWKDLDAAIHLARSVGYTHVATFANRRRTLQPLG